MFQNSLHGLRGVAAFMVFIAHCVGGYALNLCDDCNYKPALSVINNIGTFGVEIFFILSGYVITAASLRTGPKLFFIRRFWRLYPILLLFTILFFIGNFYLGLEPEKNRWDYLLYNLTFTNLLFDTPALTPNAWTITYEVMFYLLTYGLVYSFIGSRNLLSGILFSLLALLFFIKYPISIYFVLGVLTYFINVKYSGTVKSSSRKNIFLAEGLSAVLILVLSSFEVTYRWSWLLSHPTAFILMIAVFIYINCLLSGKSLSGKWLEKKWILYLGTISYSLYLAHPYSYLLTRSILLKLENISGMDLFTSIWVFLSFALVATLSVSVIVHKLVEAPAYRFMTGRPVIGKH